MGVHVCGVGGGGACKCADVCACVCGVWWDMSVHACVPSHARTIAVKVVVLGCQLVTLLHEWQGGRGGRAGRWVSGWASRWAGERAGGRAGGLVGGWAGRAPPGLFHLPPLPSPPGHSPWITPLWHACMLTCATAGLSTCISDLVGLGWGGALFSR